MAAFSRKRQEWEDTRAAVLKRDGGQCVYCRARADTVDHVIPKSAPGSTDLPDNLVAACNPCNAHARDKVYASFAEKKAAVRKNFLMRVRTCRYRPCGKVFSSPRWWKRFCSTPCSSRHHVEAFWRRKLGGTA